MTLEEAKDILECSDKDYFMETLYETYHQSNVKKFEKAIDTVLKALEDSIPKEKVREKIKELKSIEPRDDEYNYDLQNEVGFKLDVLNELLRE